MISITYCKLLQFEKLNSNCTAFTITVAEIGYSNIIKRALDILLLDYLKRSNVPITFDVSMTVRPVLTSLNALLDILPLHRKLRHFTENDLIIG